MASVLIIETLRSRFTLHLLRAYTIWEIREYCRELFDGNAPQTITLSGNTARATYAGTKHL